MLGALNVLMVLLPLLLEVLLSMLACAKITIMEMLQKLLLFLLVELLLCALHVTSVAPTVSKPQPPILCLLLACAQRTPTEMVPRAHSALLTLRPLAGVLVTQ